MPEPSSRQPRPDEEAVSREEQSLVWQALERIPETYREPLILFYREDQSVAEVAGGLVLSEDAVKQRLSRGRAMLREQVADLVEAGLRRSRPGRRFTLTVMAGLAAHAGAKTALAGAGRGRGQSLGGGTRWQRPAPVVHLAAWRDHHSACWAHGSVPGFRPRPHPRCASALRFCAAAGDPCSCR